MNRRELLKVITLSPLALAAACANPNPPSRSIEPTRSLAPPPVAPEAPRSQPIPAEAVLEPGWKVFRSLKEPYQIGIPGTWVGSRYEFGPNLLLGGKFVEGFENPNSREFAPTTKTTLNLAVEPVQSWVTLEDYGSDVFRRLTNLTAAVRGTGNPRVGQVPYPVLTKERTNPIGIHQALWITGHEFYLERPYEYAMAITLARGKAWRFTLVTHDSETKEQMDMFIKTLQSFKLLQ